MFANHTSNNELASRMYRELSKFNSKGKKNPTRKQATLEKTLYQREYMEGKLEHKKIINIIGVYYAPIE